MKIYTVLHTHKHGVDVIPCASMAIAEKTLEGIQHDADFMEEEEFIEISVCDLKE